MLIVTSGSRSNFLQTNLTNDTGRGGGLDVCEKGSYEFHVLYRRLDYMTVEVLSNSMIL